MRQEVILFIVLLSCIVAFLSGAIFMMMRSYRIMVRERYDFLTKFPYEGFEARSYYGRWAIILILLYVLSLGISFFFAMFARRSLPGQGARDMVVAIVGGLLSLSTCGYLFVDAGNMRKHLGLFVTYSMLLALSGITYGLLFLDLKNINEGIATGFGIACFVIAAVGAIIVLNPKLSSWSKLKKIGDGGSALYVRPRPFALAFSEWILLFVGPLLSIVGMIGLVVLSGIQLG